MDGWMDGWMDSRELFVLMWCVAWVSATLLTLKIYNYNMHSLRYLCCLLKLYLAWKSCKTQGSFLFDLTLEDPTCY